MRFLALAAGLLLLAVVAPLREQPARADMFPDASNAKQPEASNNLNANPTAHTYYAQAYGNCTWDATHDVGPCVNQAIAAAIAGAGGKVVLPAGVYGLSTTIQEVASSRGVSLEGAGGPGNYGVCGTSLKWLGAVDGLMVQFGADGFNQNVVGAGLRRVCLDGNSIAGIGVSMRSISSGVFEDVSVSSVTIVGWDLAVSPAAGIGPSDNFFSRTLTGLGAVASAAADGWRVGAQVGGANVHHNTWISPHIQKQNGVGMKFGNTDSNSTYGLWSQNVGGSGLGLELQGSNISAGDVARSNRFYWSEAQGGTIGRGTSSYTFASRNNTVEHNAESGAPAPVVEAGATLFCRFQNGSAGACSPENLPLTRVNIVNRNTSVAVTPETYGGTHVNNANAGATTTYTLPTASGSGVNYCFYRYGFNVVIAATGSDVILVGPVASAAGGTVSTIVTGSAVCLADIRATRWQAYSSTGTWAAP